MILLGHRLPMT